LILDIRISTDLYRHRKYKKLKRLLGGKQAMDYLLTFWCNVAEQLPNGALNGWSNEDIEMAADWDGESGIFHSAMIDSGFLDVTNDGFKPHDWDQHQPWVVSAKERSEAARIAGKASALARRSKYGTAQPAERLPNGSFENCSTDTERIPNASRTPSPSPNRKSEQIFGPETNEMRLAKYLFAYILQNNPKAKEPNFNKWASQFDLILRVDGRSSDDTKAVISWCQKDEFWKVNILSPDKLRKQFDQLFVKMSSTSKEINKPKPVAVW